MKSFVQRRPSLDSQAPAVTSDVALDATVVVGDGTTRTMTAAVHADPMMAMTLISLGALLVVGLALFVLARILKKR